jgi:hypothetical protein
MTKNKTIIGWGEWVQMAQIGLPLIKAKADTGARTSALHAFDIESITNKGAPWVRFKIHPLQGNNTLTVQCEAPVVDRRLVTDSGGKGEKRLVIETFATVGDVTRAIELTLTNREKMAFRMLLGRQAMERFGFIVDSSYPTLLTKVKQSTARAAYENGKKPKIASITSIKKDIAK